MGDGASIGLSEPTGLPWGGLDVSRCDDQLLLLTWRRLLVQSIR